MTMKSARIDIVVVHGGSDFGLPHLDSYLIVPKAKLL